MIAWCNWRYSRIQKCLILHEAALTIFLLLGPQSPSDRNSVYYIIHRMVVGVCQINFLPLEIINYALLRHSVSNSVFAVYPFTRLTSETKESFEGICKFVFFGRSFRATFLSIVSDRLNLVNLPSEINFTNLLSVRKNISNTS